MKNIIAAFRLLLVCAALAIPAVACANSPYVGPSVFFGPTQAQISGAGLTTAPETHLDKEQQAGLLKNLAILKEYPRVVIRLEGHASSLECSPDSCLDLSIARLRLVYEYLVKNGVQPSRIRSLSAFGSSRTEIDHGDGTFEQKGRVEIVFEGLQHGT